MGDINAVIASVAKDIARLTRKIQWCKDGIVEARGNTPRQRHFALELKTTDQFLAKAYSTLATLNRTVMIRNMRQSEARAADAIHAIRESMPGKGRIELVRSIINNETEDHIDVVHGDIPEDISTYQSSGSESSLDDIIASTMQETLVHHATTTTMAASSAAPLSPMYQQQQQQQQQQHRRGHSRQPSISNDMSHMLLTPPSGFSDKQSHNNDDEGPYGMPLSLMPDVPATPVMARKQSRTTATLKKTSTPSPATTATVDHTSGFECLEGM